MMAILRFLFTLMLLSYVSWATNSLAASAEKIVEFETSEGKFKVELDQKAAPKTVENFLKYVKNKHYDGTIFHRVIPGFMIQGGGLTKDLKDKGSSATAIKNEAANGLKNIKGSVAMARTSEIDSATDQFFINVNNNDFLDHVPNNSSKFGYAVFGKIISGMDVVEKIVKVKTEPKQEHEAVPVVPIEIKSVRLLTK